jgi:hypothetical protein
MRGLLAVLLAATVSSPVWAIDLPEYDIRAYCSSQFRGGLFDKCMDKVSADKRRAVAQSKEFKDAFVRRCISDPRVKIYSELLDCFAFTGTKNDLK